MRRLFLILYSLLIFLGLNSQTVSRDVVGKVSFISSQNVYVKFKSTSGIQSGDTLFITSGNKRVPAFIVSSLSSMSCVCKQITSETIPVDHLVIARPRVNTVDKQGDKATEVVKQEVPIQNITADTSVTPVKTVERKQNIRGSLSLNSYTDLSNTPAKNSQRFRYVFSLDARNIGNSRISAETYILFSHKAGEWQTVQNDIFSALKIYSLALKYDITKTMNVSLGRRINPRLSNIGAMDGIEYEASVKRFKFGAVSGFRPDYSNYSFNSKLFQFGGYASFNTKNGNRYTESSLAFMQQMNGSKTDRRFIYFQHSNALIRNIYLFTTFEVDLYKLVNDKPTTTFDLTGFYLSLRYRMTKNFSLSGSYDARKNVIYYETYKNYTEQLLESVMRQGFRLQINYRISNKLMAGLSGGYRYTKSDPHPSENLYGYLTYSQIAGKNMSVTLSGTYLQSGYMSGIIAGANISHGFFSDKLVADLGYKYTDYDLPESSTTVKQNVGELSLSMPVSRNLFLSAYYEGTFEKKDNYNRIYLQVRIRF